MAAQETNNKSPKNPSNKRSPRSAARDGILSPTFRSAAAMAGWDEEALLLASLVVDDTPVRDSRHKKRPRITTTSRNSKSPPSTKSNRRRRLKRQDPNSIPAVVLCLDDGNEEDAEKGPDVLKKREAEDVADDKEKNMKGEEDAAAADDDREKKGEESGRELPCMDRLREELSCAICLEICFEPSTTPCGHSFCLKCLKCAAAKCGKRCPKCRQLISNGRSCTINTVLWNTIQLLFPGEVEARKGAAAATNPRDSSIEPKAQGPPVASRNTRTSSSFFVSAAQVSRDAATRRRGWPSQFEDAALALRLQREEFCEEEEEEEPRQTLHSARANLRALASRAYHIRTRGRY